MRFDGLITNEDTTIIKALEKINKNAKKVLFIVKERELVASVTDGDIRRWILQKGDMSVSIKECANYHPKFLYTGQRIHAKEFMNQYHIEVLPIVNQKKQIVDMIYVYDLAGEKEVPMTALKGVPVVIMAGGLGTRLYPYTKILPKPLIPIGDIPITEHIMNRFHKYGCIDFYLIVNHKKNMIKAYYNEIQKDYTIHYIDEDQPLGTGGGIGLLRKKIQSTFILTNCDTLIDEDYGAMIEEHKKNKNDITMVCSLKSFDIPYGVVEIGKNGAIDTMKEKPNYSFYTNTGTYIVEPDIIDSIKPMESIGFPDVIQNAKKQGKRIGSYTISDKAWMDMGQFDSMEEMRDRMGV